MEKETSSDSKVDRLESKDLEIADIKGDSFDTGGTDAPAKSIKNPSRPRRERRIDEDRTSQAQSKDEESSAQPEVAGVVKPRRRRVADEEPTTMGSGGGWMSISSEKNKTSKLSIEEDDEVVAPVAQNKDKHFQEGGDDIMIIPDLDEDGDGDARIAHAPKNIHRKIPSLADLEDEVKAAIPTIEGGFNLTVLLATLVPQSQVQEADLPWTFESLLRDVTDELMAPIKTITETTIKDIPAPTSAGGAAAVNVVSGKSVASSAQGSSSSNAQSKGRGAPSAETKTAK